MPHIVVNGPPIKDMDKKRVLVKEITDVIQKVYEVPRQAIVIVIREDSSSNVGSGGTLLSDK
jgi:4-oxalocrotonate tautomerase